MGSGTPSIVDWSGGSTESRALGRCTAVFCRQIIVLGRETHKGAAICVLPGPGCIVVKQTTPDIQYAKTRVPEVSYKTIALRILEIDF